jgi:hypothetical protein
MEEGALGGLVQSPSRGAASPNTEIRVWIAAHRVGLEISTIVTPLKQASIQRTGCTKADKS